MSILNSTKIGCIGIGNMGSAIVYCLSKNIKKENIYCFDTDAIKLESVKSNLGINITDSAEHLIKISDVIIIAVKPDIVHSVLEKIRDKISKKLLISIAAGVNIDSINKVLQRSGNVIRVMPNTPVLIGEGMSVISSADTDERSIKTAEEIFSYIGRVIFLPEKLMDAVTALSGCGPAYGFTVIQAMADAGVKIGLPRDKATILAAQSILGAAKMVLESKDDPISLRGKVTSPGGATIEAVHILERAGFSGILMDAIEAAKIKSEKLGK